MTQAALLPAAQTFHPIPGPDGGFHAPANDLARQDADPAAFPLGGNSAVKRPAQSSRGQGNGVAAPPRSADDLTQLLLRVASEDHKAFQMLFRATSAKLYSVVFRILRRKDLADEIVQEAYLRIWRRAASFDRKAGSAIAWMAVIARNLALDELRRAQPISIEDRPEVLDMPDEFNHPLDAREKSEDGARLMACLEGMEKDRREMLLLAYYHGMSREELAAKYGAPVGTVKTWLRRGLLQLRACLGDD
jgi:RNA polymerase sigma-70 factor (ECF subfamily)